MPRTKIEFNAKKIDRIQGLDELAAILFPGNRNHQKVFLAIFIEIKYSKDGSSLISSLSVKNTVSLRGCWRR